MARTFSLPSSPLPTSSKALRAWLVWEARKSSSRGESWVGGWGRQQKKGREGEGERESEGEREGGGKEKGGRV